MVFKSHLACIHECRRAHFFRPQQFASAGHHEPFGLQPSNRNDSQNLPKKRPLPPVRGKSMGKDMITMVKKNWDTIHSMGTCCDNFFLEFFGFHIFRLMMVNLRDTIHSMTLNRVRFMMSSTHEDLWAKKGMMERKWLWSMSSLFVDFRSAVLLFWFLISVFPFLDTMISQEAMAWDTV